MEHLAPHNKEAEQAVLGCLLLSQGEQAGKISHEWFYSEAHRIILKTIQKLKRNNEPIDYIMLNDRLVNDKNLEKVGGAAYITALTDNVATVTHLPYYLMIVAEKWAERQAKKPAIDANKLISLGREIEQIKQSFNKSIISQTVKDALDKSSIRTVADIVEDHKRTLKESALVTGYPKLDASLTINKGDFNVIQSMSNHGKTSFMLNLVHNLLSDTSNKNADCIFITYESSALRLEERFLSILAKIRNQPQVIAREHNLYTYSNNIDSLSTTYNEWIKEKQLKILTGVPFEDLPAIISQCKNPGHVLCLFLDYIQIIPNSFKSEGWQKIKDLAYGLEALAVENEVIIFTGSQVNESGETREGKDVYNAATSVIDIFNHSHSKLKDHPNKRRPYKEPINNKSVVSLILDKSKYSEHCYLEDYFLFDGYQFKVNDHRQETTTPTKKKAFRSKVV